MTDNTNSLPPPPNTTPPPPRTDTDEIRRVADEVINKRKLVTESQVTIIARQQAEAVFNERADQLAKAVQAADTYVRMVEGRINRTDGSIEALNATLQQLREDIRRLDARGDRSDTEIALIKTAIQGGDFSIEARLKKIEASLTTLPHDITQSMVAAAAPFLERFVKVEKWGLDRMDMEGKARWIVRVFQWLGKNWKTIAIILALLSSGLVGLIEFLKAVIQ